ncbi:MAG: tRNA (guanine(10)-N2)-dimethyltransferase [Euryarchaeota archaeon ADurb.Bin294]|nr:MAG: tRNA (guanine(10)-N2)-dimethyltransferase [Euryarchaeota archaeon ADurb.Bin294]
MKLILELSGEHPAIPVEEVKAILPVFEQNTQVLIAEAPSIEIINRFAYTHAAMTYIGTCPADKESFIQMLKDLDITSPEPFCGRVKKMADHGMDTSSGELERLIGSYVKGQVSVSSPERVFRVVIVGGTCYFGELIWELDRSPYHTRKPGNRPFFHPGVMMPRMIRALINMSGALPGEWVLDPFCGTGGTLIEASLIGCNAAGTDADHEMIAGSRKNLSAAMAGVADARYLPFPDGSIDHVVSDLPYGQSVTIIGNGLNDLYHQALTEIKRVVKKGNHSVLVTHQDIRPLAYQHCEIIGYYEQRVHKSLTRRILVIR